MHQAVNDSIAAAIDELPNELTNVASRWYERLAEAADYADIPEHLVPPLTRLVACSDFAADVLLREWQWFVEHRNALLREAAGRDLDDFAESIAASEEPVDAVKRSLRRFRNRFLVHVLWREITAVAALEETLESLSHLADRLLDAAARYSQCRLMSRFGHVRDGKGEVVPIIILGMGKLGGRELNFSSDIDLIFLFPEGTESDGDRCLSAQEYFARLSRHIISLLDEVTADGFVFRIDTRLRPFGDSGPAVVSFAALESYLLQHGRDWERYAYVKACIVGPQPEERFSNELYQHLINPFVYRRYLDFGVFESLRGMQALIATEVRRQDLADNIKRGPGGIREIEFIVQSLQLVRGGSRPELQSRELQEVLPRLVGRRGLEAAAANELAAAYRFLRRLENFLQAINDQQTHNLPGDVVDRARLCLAMGYPDWDALAAAIDSHRQKVTNRFQAIAFRGPESDAKDHRSRMYAEAWEHCASVERWQELLAEAGVPDAEKIARELHRLRNSPRVVQIDSTAMQRLQALMPDLLLVSATRARPLIAITRTLGVIERVLRRSAYIALLNENGAALSRLVDLCEKSTYIADQIARYPVLLDELLDPRIYTARIARAGLETELAQRLDSGDLADQGAAMELLAQFQRAWLFRVAVADVSGNLPIMKVSDALTDIAEVVLGKALLMAWKDLTASHGVPEYTLDGKTRRAGFGVIAYGKLGGIELSYGSDLDLVFLHDSRGEKQQTSGARPIDNSMFFVRLVRRLVHYLTTQTGSGILYEVDMRLRPDGRSGLLVTSTDAFERYQEENAWTWEHQALLRARPVAGDSRVTAEFTRIRAETLSSRVRRETLRDDVVEMRQRMRRELDRSDADRFDLKQGPGGIADIEFIVQYLVLRNARDHPAVIVYSDNIRQLDALAASGCLAASTARQLQDAYRAYRLRVHRLVIDDRRPLVEQTEFITQRELVTAVWESTFAGSRAD